MERVVRRSELNSGESSPDDSPKPSPHIGDLISFEYIEQAVPQIEQQDVEENEDEMDFCLFAPTSGNVLKPAQSVSRIRLKSPTPMNAEPGLENPHRDRRYYFTDTLGPEELQRFESTAISGYDVRNRACGLCPGSSYAWKVQHVRATKAEASLLARASAVYNELLISESPSKRKRPGKQSRIKSRIKHSLLQAAQIEDQKAAELKEAADREKRTRRNREKKAKKKIREKAKKAAGGAAAGNVESDGPDSEDETSSQPG